MLRAYFVGLLMRLLGVTLSEVLEVLHTSGIVTDKDLEDLSLHRLMPIWRQVISLPLPSAEGGSEPDPSR